MKAVRKLLVYAKPYWKWLAIAPFLMVVEVAMDLMMPRLISRIVDIGIANEDLTFVINTGLTMVGLAFVGAIGAIFNGYFASKGTQAFGADLREALFEKVQSLSFANLDTLETGPLITRLTNDVTQVRMALQQVVRILVRAPMLMIGSFIMFVLAVPQLTWIPAVLLGVISLGLGYIISRAFPMFRVVQKALDNVNVIMQENLSGVRVVKAFVRADHEIDRFGVANEELRKRTMDVARVTSFGFPMVLMVLNLGFAAVLWFGGLDFKAGTMSTGEVIEATNYLVRALFSLTMVVMILMQTSRAVASAERIVEVMDTEPTVQNQPTTTSEFDAKGRVVFENVSFRYERPNGLVGEGATERQSLVLDDISFSAEPGQTVAILGSTGSGKSTLVHLVPRFYDVTDGRITVDGVNIRDLDKKALRRNIGIALQETVLFSGTIRDNIRYGRPDATDEEVVAAAKAAQAHEFITAFPNGYDTELGQRGVNVSGGQKQRIAIARALLLQPAILILDDSTSSVDVETETKIQDALKVLMENRTSFVIAQRVSTVLTADKILVLDDGKIAAEGNHAELLVTSPIYRDIYDSQLGAGGAE